MGNKEGQNQVFVRRLSSQWDWRFTCSLEVLYVGPQKIYGTFIIYSEIYCIESLTKKRLIPNCNFQTSAKTTCMYFSYFWLFAHLISCLAKERKDAVLLLEYRQLDKKLDIKDGAMLVDQVRLVPRKSMWK